MKTVKINNPIPMIIQLPNLKLTNVEKINKSKKSLLNLDGNRIGDLNFK